MRIRQSDLSSFARCAQQMKLERAGAPREGMSATAFGTVVHHVMQVMEKMHVEGQDLVLETALSTFEHYWDPSNRDALVPEGIQIWLPRETYGGLRDRGRHVIKDYYELLKSDPSELLALEYQFFVPLEVDGVTHELSGTMDRLAVRRGNYPEQVRRTARKSGAYLSIDDFKTGRKPRFLRFNVQGHMYAYASEQVEFWKDFPEPEALHQKAKDWPRRFRWIDLKTVTYHDGGWRVEQDHLRLKAAVREYIRAVEADVFPLNMSGETCQFCPFARNGTCGGAAIAED